MENLRYTSMVQLRFRSGAVSPVLQVSCYLIDHDYLSLFPILRGSVSILLAEGRSSDSSNECQSPVRFDLRGTFRTSAYLATLIVFSRSSA